MKYFFIPKFCSASSTRSPNFFKGNCKNVFEGCLRLPKVLEKMQLSNSV